MSGFPVLSGLLPLLVLVGAVPFMLFMRSGLRRLKPKSRCSCGIHHLGFRAGGAYCARHPEREEEPVGTVSAFNVKRLKDEYASREDMDAWDFESRLDELIEKARAAAAAAGRIQIISDRWEPVYELGSSNPVAYEPLPLTEGY